MSVQIPYPCSDNIDSDISPDQPDIEDIQFHQRPNLGIVVESVPALLIYHPTEKTKVILTQNPTMKRVNVEKSVWKTIDKLGNHDLHS